MATSRDTAAAALLLASRRLPFHRVPLAPPMRNTFKFMAVLTICLRTPRTPERTLARGWRGCSKTAVATLPLSLNEAGRRAMSSSEPPCGTGPNGTSFSACRDWFLKRPRWRLFLVLLSEHIFQRPPLASALSIAQPTELWICVSLFLLLPVRPWWLSRWKEGRVSASMQTLDNCRATRRRRADADSRAHDWRWWQCCLEELEWGIVERVAPWR